MRTNLNMKMSLLTVIIVVMIGMLFPTEVHAAKQCAYKGTLSGSCTNVAMSGSNFCKKHTCCEIGCYKLTTRGVNSRCDKCQEKFLIESDTCIWDYCFNEKAAGSMYCSEHICHHGNCAKEVVSGGKYCTLHTCEKGRYGCRNLVASPNAMCTSCKAVLAKKNTSKYTNKNTTTSTSKKNTSTTSKKKVKMPDCDDYEDYDDFMDDWDGRMPDGSDASDYWDNW